MPRIQSFAAPMSRRRVVRRRKFRTRLAMARRRMGAPSVYKFKEPYQLSAPLTVANAASNSGTLVGQLSALTNIAEYQGLFDLYRINGMKVTFLPGSNSASPSDYNVGGGGGYVVPGQLPYLYIAPNRDPLIPGPGSVADILNDDGVKCVRLDRKRSFYISMPNPDIKLADGSTMPLILPSKVRSWLQTGGNGSTIDQSLLKHYGFRWLIDNTTNPNTYTVNVIITLYFSLKERD